MYRGTTPVHIFKISIDPKEIKDIKINYTQNGKLVLCKRLCDCDITDGKITTKLTQEETFRFDCRALVTVQMRVITTGGDALISLPIKRRPGECVGDSEVLV